MVFGAPHTLINKMYSENKDLYKYRYIFKSYKVCVVHDLKRMTFESNGKIISYEAKQTQMYESTIERKRHQHTSQQIVY